VLINSIVPCGVGDARLRVYFFYGIEDIGKPRRYAMRMEFQSGMVSLKKAAWKVPPWGYIFYAILFLIFVLLFLLVVIGWLWKQASQVINSVYAWGMFLFRDIRRTGILLTIGLWLNEWRDQRAKKRNE